MRNMVRMSELDVLQVVIEALVQVLQNQRRILENSWGAEEYYEIGETCEAIKKLKYLIKDHKDE